MVGSGAGPSPGLSIYQWQLGRRQGQQRPYGACLNTSAATANGDAP